jgi:hypothetical protein
MVNSMKETVFFADVLGFSSRARLARGASAIEALSDVAHILSKDHAVARYLQLPVWRQRYGLSDSIFLVGSEPLAAAAAAAEFFFNLAYYNATQASPVLMRGAITIGEVRRALPIFPETAKESEAVVRAVQLENSGTKGPRLMVAKELAECLKASSARWLLDRAPGCPHELLWPLPPDGAVTDGPAIGDVAAVDVRLTLMATPGSDGAQHHLAYLDLVMRSLLRLQRRFPAAARAAVDRAQIRKLETRLRRVSRLLPDRGVQCGHRFTELLR